MLSFHIQTHLVRKMSIRFALLVAAISVATPAMAEISINPFPLGYSSNYPPARSETTAPAPVHQAAPSQSSSASQEPLPLINVEAPHAVNVEQSIEQTAAQSVIAATYQWRAVAGANAKQVLDFWSRDAGVEVIWNAQDNYGVIETVDMEGTFEEAVATLLGQYKRNYIRPVGSLHVDPTSGDKTLVVITYEGS